LNIELIFRVEAPDSGFRVCTRLPAVAGKP